LGLKAIVMNGLVVRPPAALGGPAVLESLGLDASFDYDPVWARCQELGVAPTFHGVGYGFGTRASSTNFVFNHLGSFAAAQEGVCRSLVMGGVTRRFPRLRFAFLEGGVTWACQLFADLLGHYAKRNVGALEAFDPAQLDLGVCHRLLTSFSKGRMVDGREAFEARLAEWRAQPRPENVDDFAVAGIHAPEDVVDIFTRQLYFGCEGDDPLNATAFGPLPRGARLNAFFGSDIGHWDVPEMSTVLLEAFEQLDDGRMQEDDFVRFTSGNVAGLFTSVNPAFFDGTILEDQFGSQAGRRRG
jgi:hypothetical protein